MDLEIQKLVSEYSSSRDRDVRYVIVRELYGGLRDANAEAQEPLLAALETSGESLKSVTRIIIIGSLEDGGAIRSLVAGSVLPALGRVSACHVTEELVRELVRDEGRTERCHGVLLYLLALRDGSGALCADEEDVAAYVGVLSRLRDISQAWKDVLIALCLGSAVRDARLVRKIYDLGVRDAFVAVARDSSAAVVGPLLVEIDDLGLLAAVGEACPTRFTRVVSVIVDRWLRGKLQGGTVEALRLMRALGPILGPSDTALVGQHCVMVLNKCIDTAIDLGQRSDSKLSVSDANSDSEETWRFSGDCEEAEMLETEDECNADIDEATHLVDDNIVAISAALFALAAMWALPADAADTIHRLPDGPGEAITHGLLCVGVRHPQLLDIVIAKCHDVAPESLYCLTPSQVKLLSSFPGQRHAAFLHSTDEDALAGMSAVNTNMLQHWQNSREISKGYVDATLGLIRELLSRDSTSIEDHQWCVDTLTWIGRQCPFYREPAIRLLLPVLKPPKQFVNVIQVGNMKQKQDDSIHSRVSAATTLYAWLKDHAHPWPYVEVLAMLPYLRYLLRDRYLQKHAVELYHAALKAHGELLLARDYSAAEETLHMFEEQWPEGSAPVRDLFVALSKKL
ncbi:HCL134Wp [Eremothecium sinecaudum]|uniref:HCL134Wp n=1 Tax=Eremothecium sinecaudum TaxID=45286 RepID=A0A0X8HRB4_9SACH|nr:HCL134Wp [Eremothecium sinecaudum]AMD20017.1 HCL134Wp [Eremothecium sinecaudum]